MKTTDMIKIDGSLGEGGGQVLRTSLSLAMVTGQAFAIEKIRAGRERPGLMRQHLTCVKAAADICGAVVEGAELGSGKLVFHPSTVRAGEYAFNVGTAGSTTLVAQTILPALMMASGPSRIVFEGGTHNMKCPSYDFLKQAFLPHIRNMGVGVDLTLKRRGFFPAGGGEWGMDITPVKQLSAIDLSDRGKAVDVRAVAIVSQLPRSIGERELKIVGRNLDLTTERLTLVEDLKTRGPGNVLQVFAEYEKTTEVFTGFGRLGVSAENIGKNTAKAAKRYMNGGVAVGPYLADQLLLPIALAGGGRFTAMRPSLHTKTNIETIKAFLPVTIMLDEGEKGVWIVDIKGKGYQSR